jgi:hypothetical protein
MIIYGSAVSAIGNSAAVFYVPFKGNKSTGKKLQRFLSEKLFTMSSS